MSVECLYAFAGHEVPNLHRFVDGCAGQPVVVDELQREHVLEWPLERAHTLAALAVPYLDRAAAGHELQCEHVARVADERAHALATRQTPNPDGLVGRGARQSIASQQLERSDRAGVAAQRHLALAARHAPQLDAFVVRGARQLVRRHQWTTSLSAFTVDVWPLSVRI